MKKRLTVAIPTYKRKKSLRQILECLSELDIGDCTVLVSDNHSNDGTEEVCEYYSHIFKSFKYLYQEKNVGYDLNVINCVKNCDTEYIWFLSDDDLIDQDVINAVFDSLKKEVDGVLINSDVYDIRSGKKIIDNLNNCDCNEGKVVKPETFVNYVWWSTLISSQVIKMSCIDVAELDLYVGTCFVQIGMFWKNVYNRRIQILGETRIKKYDGNEAHFNANGTVIWTKNWTKAIWLLKSVYGESVCKRAARTLYDKETVSGLVVQFIVLKKDGNLDFNGGRDIYKKVDINVVEKIVLIFISLLPCGLVSYVYNLLRKIKQK